MRGLEAFLLTLLGICLFGAQSPTVVLMLGFCPPRAVTARQAVVLALPNSETARAFLPARAGAFLWVVQVPGGPLAWALVELGCGSPVIA